jgi:hypothetical protein
MTHVHHKLVPDRLSTHTQTHMHIWRAWRDLVQGCLAAIVKDVKQLKNLMDTGAGLECESCSTVGSPTSPPR